MELKGEQQVCAGVREETELEKRNNEGKAEEDK